MSSPNFRRFTNFVRIKPERLVLTVPDFILSASVWTGASTLLSEYALPNTDYHLSLKMPITAFGSNFIAAIRWLNTDDDIIYRYRLFDHEDAILFFPLYAGERIGLNAVIEIWSVDSALSPTLTSDKNLKISVLVFPGGDSCGSASCAVPASDIVLAASPPSPMPLYAFENTFS